MLSYCELHALAAASLEIGKAGATGRCLLLLVPWLSQTSSATGASQATAAD